MSSTKVTNGVHENGGLRQRPSAKSKVSTVTDIGRESDKRLDKHTSSVKFTTSRRLVNAKIYCALLSYEFGGPIGVAVMIAIFPPLMYYFWICIWFYDGALVFPNGMGDIIPFFGRMWGHVQSVRTQLTTQCAY